MLFASSPAWCIWFVVQSDSDVRSIAEREGKISDMDEVTFQQKMQELMARINDLPENEAAESSDPDTQPAERQARIKASVAELQESLDYLRLSVKYLVFDLEATRRENRYLRRMIEQNGRDEQRRLEEDGE